MGTAKLGGTEGLTLTIGNVEFHSTFANVVCVSREISTRIFDVLVLAS